MQVLTEIAVRRIAEIGDLGGGHRHDRGIAGEGARDAADQREIALIGAGEDQPLVAVLEHIDAVRIEESGHHDLADLHRRGLRHRLAQDGLSDEPGPGAGGVGERPRGEDLAMAAVDHREPPDLATIGADAARAGADHSAALGRVDGVEHHQA